MVEMRSIGLLDDLSPAEQEARRAEVTGDFFDAARGVTYTPFDLLGAPVDLVNAALSPLGLSTDKPIMGSEHLIELYGSIFPSFQKPDNSQGEMAGRLLGGVITPAGVAKAVTSIKMDVTKEIQSIKKAKKLREIAGKSNDSAEIEEATSVASVLEANAVPLPAVLKRLKDVGEQPEFIVKDDGVYLTVTPRKASGGQTSNAKSGEKGKGASSADDKQSPLTKSEIDEILADPNLNRALQTADKISMAVNGQPYDVNLIMKESGYGGRVSSMAKQASIGRAFMMAAGESPEYKAAVFEAYGKEYPELLDAIDAKSYDDLLEKSYMQLAAETKMQFENLPISTTYHGGDLDYVTSEGGTNSIGMLRDTIQNQNMNVFRGGDRHDFLNEVDPETGLNTNEMFRAVHDYFGHGVKGNKFDATGEEIAYGSHSQMYSPLARMAMASETRGQNSFVNYTPLNVSLEEELSQLRDQLKRLGTPEARKPIIEKMKDLQSQRQYAPQKSILLPPEMIDPSFTGGMPDYLQNINKPDFPMDTKPVFHASREEGLLEVDPSYVGTRMRQEGYGSDEASAISSYDMPDRSYFFQDEYRTGDPATKGGVLVYEGQADDVYDVMDDPQGLLSLARQQNRGVLDRNLFAKDLEQSIKDFGYSGYSAPFGMGRAIQSFYPLEVQPYKGLLK